MENKNIVTILSFFVVKGERKYIVTGGGERKYIVESKEKIGINRASNRNIIDVLPTKREYILVISTSIITILLLHA